MSKNDAMVRALACDGKVRLLALEATRTTRELAERHGLSGRSARLAAEMTVANVMMAAFLKGDERLSLQLQATAPNAAYLGEIDADGFFRGRLTPAVIPEVTEVDGLLLSIKHTAVKELYRGVTAVEHESIEAALNHHLKTSDQVAAIVRIQVDMVDGAIERVYGVLAERLPEDKDRPSLDAAEFEQRLGPLRTARLEAPVDQIWQMEWLDMPVEPLEERFIRYRCRCSREKVESTLLGLGEGTLTEMRDEDHGAEVDCHYCGDRYLFTEAELSELIHRFTAGPQA